MSLFIKSDDRVAVSVDEGVNTIWVRRKMGIGIKNRVQDALMSVKQMDSKGATEMGVNLGYQNTVLLINNILAWEGPLFRDEGNNPIPCTPQMIECMDPDDALTDAVLARINELNVKPIVVEAGKPVSPKSLTTALSANGSSDSLQKEKAQSL